MEMGYRKRELPPEEIERSIAKAEAENQPGKGVANLERQTPASKAFEPVPDFVEPKKGTPPAYVSKEALRHKDRPIPLTRVKRGENDTRPILLTPEMRRSRNREEAA